MFRVFLVALAVSLVACGGTNRDPNDDEQLPDTSQPGEPTEPGLGPGFKTGGPWVSFYGTAAEMGDLAKVAAAFHIINIDVDPGTANFTDAQIRMLKAGGTNTVLSYLNIGSCEKSRDYFNKATGFVSCGDNKAAQLGTYEGYPDEIWMDPNNADHQRLIVEHVAARLAARGVDGFYLDNLELLGHGTNTKNGPCTPACKQGGLDLVRKLRAAFPDLLIVMQNGTSDVTRLGVATDGTLFRRLIDGVAHEEVYQPSYDKVAEAQLLAWKALGLQSRTGAPFIILVEDYAGSCKAETAAQSAITRATAQGFLPYVSDESGGQRVVCQWGKP